MKKKILSFNQWINAHTSPEKYTNIDLADKKY